MTVTKLIQAILEAYSRAEAKLLAAVADAVERKDRERQLAELRRQAQQIVEQLRAGTVDQALKALIAAFEEGATKTKAGTVLVNPTPNAFLAAELFNLLGETRFALLRQTEDAFRTAVAAEVSPVLLGAETRLGSAADVLAYLAERGFTFRDRSGREWELASYVEMATRTATMNAFREGRAASLLANGYDLVVIRSGPSRCPKCDPYNGKIVSLTGKHPKYPSLERAKTDGVFHPNCRCSFSAYIEGLTETEPVERVPNYYAEEQELRRLEREARSLRRIVAVTGDEAAKDQLKVVTEQIKALVEDTEGLTRKPHREQIGVPR